MMGYRLDYERFAKYQVRASEWAGAAESEFRAGRIAEANAAREIGNLYANLRDGEMAWLRRRDQINAEERR